MKSAKRTAKNKASGIYLLILKNLALFPKTIIDIVLNTFANFVKVSVPPDSNTPNFAKAKPPKINSCQSTKFNRFCRVTSVPVENRRYGAFNTYVSGISLGNWANTACTVHTLLVGDRSQLGSNPQNAIVRENGVWQAIAILKRLLEIAVRFHKQIIRLIKIALVQIFFSQNRTRIKFL